MDMESLREFTVLDEREKSSLLDSIEKEAEIDVYPPDPNLEEDDLKVCRIKNTRQNYVNMAKTFEKKWPDRKFIGKVFGDVRYWCRYYRE